MSISLLTSPTSIMFSTLTSGVTLVFSTFIPTFLTYKALSLPPSHQSSQVLHPWLTYWITNSLVLSFPRILPFDSYLRLGLHIYLLIPGRAEAIYQTYLRPWLQEHEKTIEDSITNAHDRSKAKLWESFQAFTDVFAGILGGADRETKRRELEAQRREEERQRAAGASYIQTLLARWSNQSSVEISAAQRAPNAAEPTLATKLGSVLSAAASAGLEQATSASNAANARSSSHDSAPSSTTTSTSRAAASSENRTSRMVDSLASSLAAGMSELGRNKSETDFERIEKDEVARGDTAATSHSTGSQSAASPSSSSSSWGGWLWGDKKARPEGGPRVSPPSSSGQVTEPSTATTSGADTSAGRG